MTSYKTIFILAFAMLCALNSEALTVDHLRVERLTNPSAIDTQTPKMSWILHSDEREVKQTAYRIMLFTGSEEGPMVFDSGFIETDKSIDVLLNGVSLEPSTRYFWAVIVRDNKGNTASSMEKAWFDTGLMGHGWGTAAWIKPRENLSMTDGLPIFRKQFVPSKKIKTAYIYSTALGIYDLYINGQRVGATLDNGEKVYDELKPGWTDYHKRVFYTQYEVSDMLRKGQNIMGAVVAPGWWSGTIARGYYGNENIALRVKLLITYEDDTTTEVDSDTSWMYSTKGALRSGDIYNGEVYDARNEMNWTDPNYVALKWTSVEIDKQHSHLIIQAYQGPTIRTLDNLKKYPQLTTIYEGTTNTGTTFGQINVISVTEGAQPLSIKVGQTAIIDFGQNFAGYILFTAYGANGTQLHLRFAEMLNDTGDLSRRNDGPGGSIYVENLRTAKAELYFTLAGNEGGNSYRPATTFWGYRYCEITSDADVEIKDIIGLPISTSYADRGYIETNSDIINQLFSNILWGQRSNILSIPTDCPQRDERYGWTADTQVYSMAGMFSGDLTTFYRKWLTDLRDGQREDGAYYVIAPVTWLDCGASAWSDAGIIVPWNTYRMSGDIDIIRENYIAMEKYMGWLATQKEDGYLYQGADTLYGDWLSFAHTDPRMVSVAYYANDAHLMAKMSKLLSTTRNDNYSKAANVYEKLFDNIRNEYNVRFCTADGYLKEPSQTGYLLLLKYNLYKDGDQRSKAIAALRQLISDNDDRLSTGFVGTAILNQTLSDVGLSDEAYTLLLQKECPSWLYSILQGATTVWERWDSYTKEKGFNTPEMNSFNHYAYGAVAEWMYQQMAGIGLDDDCPAFKHIIFRPNIDMRKEINGDAERVTYVKALHNSDYGLIRSEWHSENGKLTSYRIEVPVGTTATVFLPVENEEMVVEESGVEVADASEVIYKGYEEGRKIYSVGSGKYNFSIVKK